MDNSVELNFEIEFITDTLTMPIRDLVTDITEEDIVNNYEVLYLDIDKVISKIDPQEQTKYPKEVLAMDEKMKNLITFINKGNKLIPPLLLNIHNDLWTIHEGQHRVGLLRYLKKSRGPFLIRKNHLKQAELLK